MKQSHESNATPQAEHRIPMLADTDINHILINGASTALSRLRRSEDFYSRLYYYAEIGAYLEVSLSRGAGIQDRTLKALQRIHYDATHLHMEMNKQDHLRKKRLQESKRKD